MPSRTNTAYLAAVAISSLLVVRGAAAQQAVPVPLPYNADLVREVGGTVSGGGVDPDTITFPNNVFPGGRTFVTQSEAAANDPADPHGLPDNGVLTLPGGGTLQLAPYAGNNVLRYATFGSARYSRGIEVRVDDGVYSSIDIYAAGEGFAPTLGVHFDYDGPSAFREINLDWNRTLPAPDGGTGTFTPILTGLDTTGPAGAGFEDVDNVGIIRWSVQVRPDLNAINIQGLGNQFNQHSSVSIFAITRTVVPEPASASALVLAALALARRPRRH